MMTTIPLGVLAVILVLGMIACLATVVDRSARAEAWQRIATERRWNHENLATPWQGRSTPDHPNRPA